MLEYIQRQLDEISCLQAMYPEADDVVLDNEEALQAAHQAVDACDNSIALTPLVFTVQVPLRLEGSETQKVALRVHLPTHYPREAAQVSINSNTLSRAACAQLSLELVGMSLRSLVLTWDKYLRTQLAVKPKFPFEPNDVCTKPPNGLPLYRESAL